MIAASPTTMPESIGDSRLREVIDLHFDPRHGSKFWLDRAELLGIDARREVRTVSDLCRLGEMSPADLRNKPLRHFVPKALHHQWHRFIVGQTGGTTGPGGWTAYLDEEFQEAFVTPFAVAAKHVAFPRRGDWLFVGPSGPHVIGKVVRSLAAAMGSCDPFSVDFDPRWAKKLPRDSFAFSRYLEHVVQQAMEVIEEQSVTVLFATPAVLPRLGMVMTDEQRQAIRGVHYGGMALSSAELARFQTVTFHNAVHLSGYGNTLFGCCLELDVSPGRPLVYFPFGDRLIFETLDAAGNPSAPRQRGQVCFTRLDRTMLIVRMRERDEASLISPPADSPIGFHGVGVQEPNSPITLAPIQQPGLY